jgi:hypothetical protein
MPFYHVKIQVKLLHVLDGRILRDMATELYKINVDLQRGIAQEAQEIGFRGFLYGHKIKNGNL